MTRKADVLGRRNTATTGSVGRFGLAAGMVFVLALLPDSRAATLDAANEAAAAAVRLAETVWLNADASRVPARNVSLPLAQHPNGAVRAVMHAGRVWAPPQGLMRAEDVEVTLYDPDRLVEGVLVMDRCLFDRQQERAVALGPVRLRFREMDLHGTNAVWSAGEQTVTFPSPSTIRLRRAKVSIMNW